MYDKIEEKTVILPPFKHFIMTVGEIPTSYLETITYYEMLVWFTNYLGKTVIPAINENGEAVTELQNLFVELQNYVNDYFENLDVQEEINNKLDDMVEAGTLQEIIAAYLNSKALFGFDTVNDMKEATNLIDGSYAKTLGYYSKNDGGMSTYKIRNITNEDIVDEMFIIALNDDNLIAELIITDKLNSKQLGIYGDRTHDDTENLQKALNSNKKITLIGDIKVTDTITIDVGIHQGIKGLNSTKLLGDFSENSFSIFRLYNSLYDDSRSGIYGNVSRFVLDNILFSNITELNETEVTHYGNGIELNDGCNNINFVNCTFSNCINGLYIPNTANGVYCNKFTSCYFRNNDYGIYIGSIASNDSGENFRFINCNLSTSKLGNYINNDMYVNFIGCSFDYNLGNTFIVQDCAVVSVSNSHIEWYASTPLINIYNNGSIKFDNSLFLKSNYDDGGNADYFITSTITASTPEILFNNCTFKMFRTYSSLLNNSAYIKFLNCSRNEYTPSTFITNKFYTLDLTQAINYEYPLNYDSGLTRNSTKVKVTCSTEKAGNYLILPILDENRDFKVTMTVVSSINLDFSLEYGVGNFSGSGITYSTGILTQNESATAGTNKTITFVYKSRRGLTTKPFVKIKLGNLTQGATFEVLNMSSQVI